MGPVYWVLLGEVFSPSKRAVDAVAGSTANWLSNFAVSLAFLRLVAWIGQGETFLISAVCFAGLAFTARWVPETRNRNYLEIDRELQDRLRAPRPERA
jgi:hypothetical protein